MSAPPDSLDLPTDGYRDPDLLQELLDDGHDVRTLAEAFDVSRKTIYRQIDAHDLDHRHPPSHGLARKLWDRDPTSIETTIQS